MRIPPASRTTPDQPIPTITSSKLLAQAGCLGSMRPSRHADMGDAQGSRAAHLCGEKVCHPTDVSVWGSMQPTRNYLGRCASGGAQRLANVQLEHDHAVGSPWRAWCLLNARPGKGRGLEATAVFTAWRPACGPPPRRLAKMQITERGLRSTSRLRTTRIGYPSVNNWTRQLRT